MSVQLGGYVIVPTSGKVQFDVLTNPTVPEVDSLLTQFISFDVGVLVASNDPEPRVGPASLTVYSEGGRYLLMLEEFSDAGECCVRMLNDPSVNNLSPMHGELYPAGAFTSDVPLVKKIFHIFIETGDVPASILSE